MAIAAVYQNGVLRPTAPLDLQDGQVVEIEIVGGRQAPSAVESREIISRIAELPDEAEPDTFSGADHDRVLYNRSSIT
jgi:predicted DNA-binding antitoxin AbrB/MazE fold protein